MNLGKTTRNTVGVFSLISISPFSTTSKNNEQGAFYTPGTVWTPQATSQAASQALPLCLNNESGAAPARAVVSTAVQLRRARALILFSKKSARRSSSLKKQLGLSAFRSWSGSIVGQAILANWGATRAEHNLARIGMGGGTRYLPHAVRSFVGNSPHTTYFHKYSTPLCGPLPPYVRGYSYTREKYRLLRFRFERWFFNTLGCRTYVWFSDIWLTVSKRMNPAYLEHMYARCMRRLAKKGSRFAIREAQAHVMFQSILLAVTTVTGLQFFMKMVVKMLQSFRSHWAVLLHTLRLFYQCKNYFWFKTLYQYRLTVRGKFGGYLRASQKVFQHGVVKLHQWDLNINYYRLCPHTKYGTFSVRFWLQLRDLRHLRYNQLTNNLPLHKVKEEAAKAEMVFYK